MTRKRGKKSRPASVEGLPADWRKQAKALCRYGGETPATAIERCADDLEATLVKRDETTFSLVEGPPGRAATPPVFPDPKTDMFQSSGGRVAAGSTGRSNTATGGARRRQADEFTAGFIDAPDGKAEPEPEPLTLETLFEISVKR